MENKKCASFSFVSSRNKGVAECIWVYCTSCNVKIAHIHIAMLMLNTMQYYSECSYFPDKWYLVYIGSNFLWHNRCCVFSVLAKHAQFLKVEMAMWIKVMWLKWWLWLQEAGSWCLTHRSFGDCKLPAQLVSPWRLHRAPASSTLLRGEGGGGSVSTFTPSCLAGGGGTAVMFIFMSDKNVMCL